jgi:hypothetical protein
MSDFGVRFVLDPRAVSVTHGDAQMTLRIAASAFG